MWLHDGSIADRAPASAQLDVDIECESRALGRCRASSGDTATPVWARRKCACQAHENAMRRTLSDLQVKGHTAPQAPDDDTLSAARLEAKDDRGGRRNCGARFPRRVQQSP